jgi:hypothetical protein
VGLCGVSFCVGGGGRGGPLNKLLNRLFYKRLKFSERLSGSNGFCSVGA